MSNLRRDLELKCEQLNEAVSLSSDLLNENEKYKQALEEIVSEYENPNNLDCRIFFNMYRIASKALKDE